MTGKHSDSIKRLNRIEGQVRGIARMIEEDRYCIDILTQIQAIKAALAKVEDGILKNHANSCIAKAVASGNPRTQQEIFDELLALMCKVKR